MHKHQRLAKLIGQGIDPKHALGVVGMSEAYYKRLATDAAFVEMLQIELNSDNIEGESKELALAKLEDHTEADEHAIRENRWAALEAATLDKVVHMLPMAELKDVNNTLKILASRRSASKQADAAMLAAQNPSHTLVTLNLPDYQRSKILDGNSVLVQTNQGQVIKAGSRDLTAMPTEDVLDLLQQDSDRMTVSVDDL